VFDGYGHMLQFRAITFGVQGFMVVAISGMVISTSLNHQGAPLNHPGNFAQSPIITELW
jgi:hypothetical protein